MVAFVEWYSSKPFLKDEYVFYLHVYLPKSEGLVYFQAGKLMTNQFVQTLVCCQVKL